MAEAKSGGALLAWVLGTFHAGFFVLSALIVLFLGGGLGDLLNELNTRLGFALFGLLCGIAWWATCRGLADLDLSRQDQIDLPDLLARAFLWGGVAGVLFLVGGAVLLLLVFAAQNVSAMWQSIQMDRPPTDALVPVAVGTIGIAAAGLVAFVIGAVVSEVLGLLDAAALIGGRLLLRASRVGCLFPTNSSDAGGRTTKRVPGEHAPRMRLVGVLNRNICMPLRACSGTRRLSHALHPSDLGPFRRSWPVI